jgi:uncharacterized membrane protein
MSILILLTYPLFSHIFVISGHPVGAALYLLAVIVIFLIKAVYGKNLPMVLVTVALLIAGASLVMQERSTFLMYTPPIVINLGLLMLFGSSLRRGHIPLITQYAQLLDGNLNQEISLYTKRVTQIWTVLFLVMLIESIGLAIFSTVAVWSLFNNFLNYILIILLFVVEYIYRNVAYPDLPKRSFFQFLYQITQIRHGQLRV